MGSQSNSDLVKFLMTLRESDELEALYERHDVDPEVSNKSGRVKMLVEAIRLDGSNSFASFFRGEGVAYAEVVRNVASKLGVEYGERTSLRVVESRIIDAVIETYVENAPPEEREETIEILRQAGVDYRNLKGPAFKAALAAAGTLAKKQIATKITTMLAARQAGKYAATAAGYAIPVINLLLAAWTIADIAGPAYRKIVPTVIEISMLKLQNGEI